MLINCSECGKQVSDQASICPKCGAPITQKTIEEFQKRQKLKEKKKSDFLYFLEDAKKWAIFIAIVLVIAVILYYMKKQADDALTQQVMDSVFKNKH